MSVKGNVDGCGEGSGEREVYREWIGSGEREVDREWRGEWREVSG